MAAAVRRAVQQQGAQQLQALHWPISIRGGAVPVDAVTADMKSRLPSPMISSGHEWIALQDRRMPIPHTTWNHGTSRGYYMRHISQLVSAANSKRAFLVDTLALVRRLESQGLTAKQAEAITAVITEVLNDSLETVSQSFTSKSEMQRSEMIMEAALSKFKGEMQSNQEHHFSLLQRETERLRTDIDKMRSELRYEVDKVTAGHRLDLNLERGRIRDELANQGTETSNLTNKLDREIHTLKTQLEAAKYDLIKYCIGSIISVAAVGLATIVSVTAVGLGILRVVM